ncbi:hypothetical protein MAR_004514, partial [Mya arenaria]
MGLKHRGWSCDNWSDVLFSDESMFNVSVADGRRRVNGRRGERYAQCYVLEADRWEGDRAGISRDHKTELHVLRGRINAVNYMDIILQPIVISFMRAHRLRHLLQDNARPNVAR